ncbi:DUF309 domain-containing protein [Mycolicibacterium sediminis]|uniref:DUF309 domain-containing protein n=1 Tax=Mycolicibacterium sediminis TaxID=1286180 RepID=A0A7I7R0E0_9MYCO|nr:DUF309 domain-containing protein [Mycolicibacterium sediminis]BBY31687.1 hypothetical protein MSEDJ_57830 [Mycolicibacterium sediminis]
MTERDRDDEGRALNARPRDALGRPLPRGAQGVPRIPDDPDPDPRRTLATAQRLLDDGNAFHAHDVLEAAWKAATDDERWLWRGLAQLAVGLTHAQRGNRRGAAALLRRGAEGIDRGDVPHGVDAEGLIARARALADDLDDGRDPPPGTLRLTLIKSA